MNRNSPYLSFYEHYTGKHCVYCDQPAESEDHIPPISLLPHLIAQEKYPKRICVPCCQDCNKVLSNKPLYTLPARRKHIAKRGAERFKKILSRPAWTEEDLDELGYAMKLIVMQGLEERQRAETRLKSMKAHANDNRLTPNKHIWD